MNFMAPYNSEHMVSLSKNENKEGRSRNALVSGRRAPTAFAWARIAYMQQEKMSDLATQWLAKFCQLFQLHDKRWTNLRAPARTDASAGEQAGSTDPVLEVSHQCHDNPSPG
jgi:hypothetical protein